MLARELAKKKHKNSKRKLHFTDATIRKLKADGKRTIYWCEGLPGFGIRVSATGNKTWIYMYRFERRSRMMTLGTYPKMPLFEARKAFSEASATVEIEDFDPGANKVQSPSLSNVLESRLL